MKIKMGFHLPAEDEDLYNCGIQVNVLPTIWRSFGDPQDSPTWVCHPSIAPGSRLLRSYDEADIYKHYWFIDRTEEPPQCFLPHNAESVSDFMR